MISLNKWFARNARYPLILSSVFIAIVTIVFISTAFIKKERNQISVIKQLTQSIFAVAITQNNRPLLESAFTVAAEDLGVNVIILCNNDEEMLSIPFSIESCKKLPKAKITEKFVTFQPSGFSSYRVYAYIDRLHNSWSLIYTAAFTFFFLIITFLLTYRVQWIFDKEIISPIANQLLSEKEIKILEINDLRKNLKQKEMLMEKELSASSAIAHKKSLAHNIKSKIHTLRSVHSEINKLIPERSNKTLSSLIKSFTTMHNNLNDIVQKEVEDIPLSKESFDETISLVNRNRSFVNIIEVLNSCIEHKKSEFKKIKIHFDLTPNLLVFSKISELQFRHIISNLINNSIEANALEINFEIKIDSEIIIRVIDNGNGIAPDVIDSLFEKDITAGKIGGTGFGLFHAKRFLESWNGTIKVLKTDNAGSTFELSLPKWEPQRIEIPLNSKVSILDDDPNVHENWENLLGKRKDVTITKFNNTNDFERWIDEDVTDYSNLLCFIDNDLGEKTTGSELIVSLGIQNICSLVSNSFDDPVVVSRCESSNIPIIPKIALEKYISI